MVPLAPRSPEAALPPRAAPTINCRDAKAKRHRPSPPSCIHTSEVSPRYWCSQHSTYLAELLGRRPREAEHAAPPSPACREGFATQSIISSLSGFNGQLSSQLLPARLIYSIKRHFSLCPCLHAVIKLPLAYQCFRYPRQPFISWHGLFPRVSFLTHSFSESLLHLLQFWKTNFHPLCRDADSRPQCLPCLAHYGYGRHGWWSSHPALQSPLCSSRITLYPSQAWQHTGTVTRTFSHYIYGSFSISGQHNSCRLYGLQTQPLKRMYSQLNRTLQHGPGKSVVPICGITGRLSPFVTSPAPQDVVPPMSKGNWPRFQLFQNPG